MKKIFTAFFCILSLTFISCADEETQETRITSFEFKKSSNTFIPAAIKGVIDEDSKLITVSFDSDFYADSANRSLLKASIGVTGGTTVVTKASDMNFSESPVLITVASSAKTVTYTVKIRKAGSAVFKNDVLFTEYYNGSSYNYKGANNQFLEISNVSEKTLDLSDVYLNRHVWIDGVRHSELDQSVPLSGVTLDSGKCLVLYSQRCNWFKTSSVNNSTFMSDKAFNGIISFTGQDAFTLSTKGNVIDVLGPENGMGSGLNWGTEKQMQANDRTRYTSYDESEWIITKATNVKKDAAKDGSDATNETAGYSKPRANNTTYKNTAGNIITYFEFENLNDPYEVEVNHNTGIITVNFYMNETSLVQKPAVSCSGVKIAMIVNGKNKGKFKSNETAVDFAPSVNDENQRLQFVVTSKESGGDPKTYTVVTKVTPYMMDSKVEGTYEPVSDISEIKTGDIIMFYLPSESYTVGSTVTGNYLAEYEGSPETYQSGMAAFCVTKDEKEQYSFTWKNKFLTSGETGNALLLKKAPSSMSLWKFRSAGEGKFYVDSVNAKYSSKSQGLEYYASKSAFSTYTVNETDAYKFQIYKKQ